jgi:inner membrane protein
MNEHEPPAPSVLTTPPQQPPHSPSLLPHAQAVSPPGYAAHAAQPPMPTPPQPSAAGKLFQRAVTVTVLVMLLLIPLLLIRSTITERASFRDEAMARVVKNTTASQQLVGPLLVLPWTDVVEVMATDERGLLVKQPKRVSGHVLRAPARLQVNGQLVPGSLSVGLFDVSVYEWRASLKASFAGALPLPVQGTRSWGTPYLVFGIADVRGLVGAPILQVDGKALPLVASTNALSSKLAGVHAVLPEVAGDLLPVSNVAFDFVLKGTHALRVVPLGDDTRVELTSSWPHPKFDGYSPRSEISDHGFKAVWEISALASNVRDSLLGDPSMRQHELGEDKVDDVSTTKIAGADTLAVSLVDPVDIYTQTDRASKYGILFVLLTFVGFVAFELIKRLSIHPMQYLLVGLALAIFFLMLLSLSEHISFWRAYLISAGACIGLQTAYLSGVLKSWLRASGFAVMLTTLYGVLYGLLASEDNALLMGSLLLFAVLSAIMFATRKVNWYELGASLR